MSTYLLAFVIGDLQKKSTKTKNNVDINIYATVAQPADSLDFALDVAKKSVEYFEDYFGVPYPLPKLDHVACPDFSNGAMENWGLITYRERVLLAYPGQTGQSMLEQIALVIAHETSHQWFGDLVTMKWWNDLWLNESFANMMEYQAVNALFPEWRALDSFVADEGLSALRRDATPGVQTIKAEVTHPDEINTLFDPSIVYAKGGRLLNMMKNFTHEDDFRRGLKLYFDKHAYSNTEGDDLWQSLSKASNQDIGAFMKPWLNQSGFPLVTIDQNGKDVAISQQHFLDSPELADPNRIWPVPLFAEGLPAKLDEPEIKIELKSDKIVQINQGSIGHYIVNYKTKTQKDAIATKVTSQELPQPDRLMLLNSSSMLARAGYDNYGNTLNLLEAYKNEDSEPVWGMMSLIIGELRRFIDLDEHLEAKIKSLANRLVAKQLARLGWVELPNESSADQKLRALILGLSSWSDNDSVIKTALDKFAVYQQNPDSVPAELRSIVFSNAAKHGTNEDFDYLLNLHDKTNNSDLQADICASLTGTHDTVKANLLLERIKNSKLVKPQDADRWLIYLMRNRHTKKLAWDFMENNWDWIEQTYAEDKSYDMLPRYAASSVNTKEYQKRFDEFFTPKTSEITLKRNIEMGGSEIIARVAWLARDLKSVKQHLG
jgi:aminopeptidase N